MNDIDELDRLHAAATAGEWVVRPYQEPSGEWAPAPSWETYGEDNLTLTAALKNAWPGISARLRAAEVEVERLRGEVASLALLVNPQAARDAAATARENRAARAILAVWEDDDLVGAARSAMAMVELYKAMWRRDMGYTQLARQAMAAGLAECERLRGALRAVIDEVATEDEAWGGSLEQRHRAALGEP